MSIIAIACVDADWGIGYQGQLLEHIPADMKFFKETTMGNTVVMGRKTQESLPKKWLPNRHNIIISNTIQRDLQYRGTGYVAYTSMEKIINALSKAEKSEDIYVIGGASIYEQLLPYCNKAYITKVYKNHSNVDAYFPNLDKMETEWELTEESPLAEYKDFYYNFQTYERI